MKEIFRFWGYDSNAWKDLVGPQKLIQLQASGSLETQFGRLRFSGEALKLLKNFAEDLQEGIPTFVQSPPDRRAEGEVIVRLERFDRSESIPLVTVDSSGSFGFHLDVDETLHFIQQEKYLKRSKPLFLKLGLAPDRFPRILRAASLVGFRLSRSLLDRMHRRITFPTLLKDLSADVWRFLVRAIVEQYATKKHERIPLWPDGKQYALVLTHDVDTEWGFRNTNGIEAFRRIEESRNLRSVWFVVTSLETAGRLCLQDLYEKGNEIGFHGIRHDHRLAYLPKEKIREQLSLASSFLRNYDCRGFRSPGYHRTPALFQLLDPIIQYDMTLHDAFENVISPLPSFEGCSTCFPFKIEGTNIVEIPTTVNEDFFLGFKGIPPDQTAPFQLRLIEKIKKRQGVANLLTHPEPQLSARREWLRGYEALLTEVVKDPSVWIPLPRDLCRWWNARQEKIDSLWRGEKLFTTPPVRKA